MRETGGYPGSLVSKEVCMVLSNGNSGYNDLTPDLKIWQNAVFQSSFSLLWINVSFSFTTEEFEDRVIYPVCLVIVRCSLLQAKNSGIK